MTTAPDNALRCSFAAELRGDPLVGTASPSAGLLLVEQPGPWGRTAFTESRLDPDVGAAVVERARAAGLRPLLIRRTGRDDAGRSTPRRWAVADCRPGRSALRWGDYRQDGELLDLPLDFSAGDDSAEPAYLVCTHGRHDACCAIRGRPVAAALEALRPGQVWECSHVGGDRFAANVIALPHGLYYGRVDAASAASVVEAQERGEVLPTLLRGRTSYAAAVQAAQDHARALTGILAIESLAAVEVVDLGGGACRVRLECTPTDLVVTVHPEPAGPAAYLTCGATTESRARVYVVDDVRRAS